MSYSVKQYFKERIWGKMQMFYKNLINTVLISNFNIKNILKIHLMIAQIFLQIFKNSEKNVLKGEIFIV